MLIQTIINCNIFVRKYLRINAKNIVYLYILKLQKVDDNFLTVTCMPHNKSKSVHIRLIFHVGTSAHASAIYRTIKY